LRVHDRPATQLVRARWSADGPPQLATVTQTCAIPLRSAESMAAGHRSFLHESVRADGLRAEARDRGIERPHRSEFKLGPPPLPPISPFPPIFPSSPVPLPPTGGR